MGVIINTGGRLVCKSISKDNLSTRVNHRARVTSHHHILSLLPAYLIGPFQKDFYVFSLFASSCAYFKISRTFFENTIFATGRLSPPKCFFLHVYSHLSILVCINISRTTSLRGSFIKDGLQHQFSAILKPKSFFVFTSRIFCLIIRLISFVCPEETYPSTKASTAMKF